MTDAEAGAAIGRILEAFLDGQSAEGGRLSCIASCAALLDVLHRLGYDKAYPLTVEARVLNPVATRHAERCGWMPDGSEAPKGSVIADIGPEAADVGPHHWAGHLVVIVPNLLGERHVLLDPTIMQANKPGTGINLPAISVTVRDDMISGEKLRQLSANGSTVFYRFRPTDHSYRDKSGWEKYRTGSPFADRVFAALGNAK